jgi:hypothetical protein
LLLRRLANRKGRTQIAGPRRNDVSKISLPRIVHLQYLVGLIVAAGRAMNHKHGRPMAQLCIFDRPLRGLNNSAVALKILRDLISPVREANVGNPADYENDDEGADANPLEPFFHGFASLAILGLGYTTPCEHR